MLGEHGKRRELVLHNAGSDEIPAYGACEIVDVERPDAGGSLTPEGGRTIYKVKKPTKNSLDAGKVVFNGPCAIPVGKERPGFNDFPTYALYGGDGMPSVGDDLGTIENSYELGTGKKGFKAWGDVNEGLVMVVRAGGQGSAQRCRATLAAAYEHGDPTVTVDGVTPIYGASPVESASEELEVTVVRDIWPSAADNTSCEIVYNETSQQWELDRLDVATQCTATLQGAYTGGSSVTVDNVVGMNGASPVADAEATLDASIIYLNWGEADDDAPCFIVWSANGGSPQWQVHQMDCAANA